MSLPTNIHVATDSIFPYTGSGQGSKKIRLRATTLLDNVAVYAVKTNGSNLQFLTLESNKKNDKFTDNSGNVQLTALLKPTATSPSANTVNIVIGAGDSADPSDNYEAAQITLNFSTSQPANHSAISAYSGSTSLINGSQIPSDFYYFIDMNVLSPTGYYCAITVNTFKIGNATFGEVETFVELHLVDPNGNLLGIIYDSSKSSNDQGAAITSVVNNSCYFSGQTANSAYLIPFIKFTPVSNQATQVNFTIGDPKTDAAVSVDEV